MFFVLWHKKTTKPKRKTPSNFVIHKIET